MPPGLLKISTISQRILLNLTKHVMLREHSLLMELLVNIYSVLVEMQLWQRDNRNTPYN